MGVLKSFANFTGKHLSQRTVFKMKLQALVHVFYYEFHEIFKKIFFTEYRTTASGETSSMKSEHTNQLSRGVLREKCSENIQQIYRRASMPKCDFNKVALQFCFTLRHGCSPVNLLHIFRIHFPKNKYGRLLLSLNLEEATAL